MSTPEFVIGIDLGTTNCTLSYASLDEEDPSIRLFSIPQMTALGETGESHSLPSFLYLPTKEESLSRLTSYDPEIAEEYCIGILARNRGAEVPGNLISSAKSWLCHRGMNRKDPILPLDHHENDKKISPLHACAKLLEHLKNSWDTQNPEYDFRSQQILITVPASFDPDASALVIEASRR